MAAAKRAFDLAGASLALLLLALPMAAIALWIRADSPGPALYRQERVGRGGRIFRIRKFRTMAADADRRGPPLTIGADPRITRAGAWLRRTRLDELPQVVNILRGEMSLVGPRPERPEFVEQLAATLPFYRARHSVRPGLTGWAQVQYHYGRTAEDARIKLEYDLYYVRHMAPLLDMQILFRTIAIALQMQGS